eukprot:gene3092-5262_t
MSDTTKPEDKEIKIELEAFDDNQKEKTMITKENMIILGVVSFYFVISIAIVFMNKFLMSNEKHKFPYPLTMTWYQLLVATLCCVLIYPMNKKTQYLSFLPDLEFSIEKAVRLLPLSLIFVGMVGFNNVTLKFVGISFYQVARSLTIVFSIIFSYIIMGVPTSLQCIGACGVVILGYVLGNIGEVQVIDVNAQFLIGVIFGLLASAFVALNSIYVKKYLKDVLNGDQWLLSLYNNVLSLFILGPLALFFEYDGVKKVDFLFNPTFIMNMSITAFLGWLINIAVYLQIKYTSPLTNSISGTAKACTQTLLAIMFLNEASTFMKVFGIILCIGGSFLYGSLKQQENNKAIKDKQSTLPK